MSDEAYAFEGLPVEDIQPGTSVLLAGPTHAGTRDLALRLLAGPSGEGTIVVTTNQGAARVVEDCKRVGIEVAPGCTAILDCVGDEDPSVSADILSIASPSDLTGIGMRYSDVYRGFARESIQRVRTGFCSVSTLLSFSDLRTISRFVHTLVGRIDSVDGFGAFFIDPTSHDEQAVSTLAQFCTGRIDVRETDDGTELRARGLPDQPRDWTSFNPSPGE